MSFSRVLVTGGAGFIGSHLIDRLLSERVEVVCIDDFNDFYNPDLKRQNIQSHIYKSMFHLVEGDIRDAAVIEAAFLRWRPEAVIHLAARAGVRPSISQVRLYESTNVAGTVNVLEAARKMSVKKFIFGSSSSVYGTNKKIPFAEGDPLLAPASPYAATKIAGEALCCAYAGIYKLPMTVLRFFTVYGPRQRPDLAIRHFAERIKNSQEITVYGDGASARDYTFIDDIVQGIMLALKRQGNLFEVYNLGNSQPERLSELINKLERILGAKAKIRRMPDQPGDVPITYADISRAKESLGYSPGTDLSEGLARFIKSLEGA